MKPTAAISGVPCACPLKLWNAMRAVFSKAFVGQEYLAYLKDQYRVVRKGDTSVALCDLACQFITYR